MARRSEETYYDVLKVDQRGTIAEIVAAYHSAKNAFSKDSVATYSLFSTEEAHEIIAKLDEAYHVLSNIDRKRAYDEDLKRRREEAADASMPMAAPNADGSPGAAHSPRPSSISHNGKESYQDLSPKGNFQALPTYDKFHGDTWKEIREKRGFSVDEVARITKIPSRAVIAIEAEDLRSLPARVYLQGFLRNLASVYRIEAKDAMTSYLKRIDELTQGKPS